jgi:hypothetical protein
VTTAANPPCALSSIALAYRVVIIIRTDSLVRIVSFVHSLGGTVDDDGSVYPYIFHKTYDQLTSALEMVFNRD